MDQPVRVAVGGPDRLGGRPRRFGAGTGAVTAKLVDLGIPDEWVDWFRKAVQPGTVILALLVTHLDENALVTETERFSGAHLVYTNLRLDRHAPAGGGARRAQPRAAGRRPG